MIKTVSSRPLLFGTTAMATVALMATLTFAQEVRTQDPGANSEPDTAPASNDAGFVFSLDGVPINADPAVEDRIRQTDIALAEADIQITFDGLNPELRLNVEIAGTARAYGPDDSVTLISELNYPAYVVRGEMLIYDRAASGGARLLTTVPVAPNGTASVLLPPGSDLVVVHRVYDDTGRYDETVPLPLGQPDDRRLTAAEDGFDSTADRNIRVGGGAVTVSATNVAQGATLYTLGEAVQADSNGRLVIQRILPPGDYAVDVEVRGPGPDTDLTRNIEVPRGQWLYVGSAELTYSGIGSDAGTETSGRLSYYVDGETDTGLRVTSSLDTGEGRLEDIFSRLDERDPRSLAERVDEADGYPTFGDDSTIVDNTPTSGRFYIRVEQDGNFGLWGDYQARLAGSEFVRNERTLYGAQGRLVTDDVTADGEARATLDVYAAQPDQLVGRDVFRGTGGSVYFLRRQDVTPGATTISVELRDSDTGRVLERLTLVEGRDYTINALQGVITLNRPLQANGTDGLIQGRPGGDIDVNLVAQYEYTPVGVEVDGLSYGARVEGWATDDLRIGLTATSDDTGVADQTAVAVDVLYEIGENSFVRLDYAQTEGPGFGSALSLDGGLTLDSVAAVAGNGQALRFEIQADFADLGVSSDGTLTAYFEERTQGFSTLDYQVTSATGDETLYGASASGQADARLSYRAAFDKYENAVGQDRLEASVELDYALSDRFLVEAGAEILDQTGYAEDGSRTDLALRLTYQASDNLAVFGYAQGSVHRDGLSAYDRYGAGLRYAIDGGWNIEGEVSDGTGGIGARVLASYEQDANQSTYFGYELDPARAIDAGISQDDNGGRFVAGGRRVLSDDLTMFGENVYDIFGTQRSLTSAYGVEYAATQFLSYDASLTLGQIEDDINGDFDRFGISLGARYATDDLAARVRAEVRMDEGSDGGTRADAETFVITADANYEIDETQRMIVRLRASDTQSDESSLLNGRVIDTTLGYALRPVLDERFNMLARLRYLSDDFGQTVDGVAGAGAVQRSLVISVEGNYDLDPLWTLGAKLGYRSSETGADLDTLTDNDAWLAVVNARYHLVHRWDVLLEARQFEAVDAGLSQTGILGAVYRQVGYGTQIGVGYNFGSFSDDLTDLTQDDGGLFVNVVASF